MHASEQSVRITTGMLGRRSLLIGATVQAINVAIHNAAENKNSNAKEKKVNKSPKGGDAHTRSRRND
jgi:hypothetical protein